MQRGVPYLAMGGWRTFQALSQTWASRIRSKEADVGS
jgi:hypothetical protein